MRAVNHYSKFTGSSSTLVTVMERTLRGLRGLSMAVLVLGALNYAHLVASSQTVQPACSGMGRIGRDLTRRSAADHTQDHRNDFCYFGS